MRTLFGTLALFVGLLWLGASACGGGEEATPSPAATATPTAAPHTAPTPTARPTSTAAPSPTSAAPTVTPTRAPQPTATPAPATSGTLTVAISDFGQDNLNPVTSAGGFENYGLTVFDTVIWHDEQGELAPGVATRWDMAPDGKAWTFTLRPMRFSDGSPVTADDVKFSVEYNSAAAAIWIGAGEWRQLFDRVEAISSTQVRITTKASAPLVPNTLAPRSRALVGVVLSKTALESRGEDSYFSTPLSSAPWKLSRHDTGIRWLFEASGVRHPYRGSPSFSRFQLLLVREESTRLAMLRTGQAQIVETTPLSLRTIRNAGFQVLEIPNIAVTSLVFPGKNNTTLFAQFPASKVKVRQALTYAIDREQIITTILEGLGTVPARHGIAPSNVGYDSSWKPDPYDPNRAKQLLAEAGYPNGFDLTVYSFPYAAIPWYPQVTEAIAGFWSELGVRVSINSTEFGSLVRNFRKRPQDATIVGTTFLLPTFIRQEPLSGLAGYYTRTAPINLLPAPDKMDDLFFKAQTTLDPNERVALTRQIVQLAYDENVTAPIALSGALYGAVKGLTGWRPIQSTPGLGFIAEHLRPSS